MTSPSPAAPAPQHRAPASFVVVLTYRGAFKGMVGPFADDDAAEEWAAVCADASEGWSWTVEPVVTPAALVEADAAAEARAVGPVARHLRVVR